MMIVDATRSAGVLAVNRLPQDGVGGPHVGVSRIASSGSVLREVAVLGDTDGEPGDDLSTPPAASPEGRRSFSGRPVRGG